jgi:hypothetical protein
MDYTTTPPPGWDTRTPDEWERAAHEARAMGRTALHYMPDLVPMFTAWAAAWDERRAVFTAADKGARASAHAAVVASVEGRGNDARRLFESAARAAECAREVSGPVSYRSLLETIPNREG